MEKLRLALSFQYKYFLLSHWLRPHHWYHVCTTHDQTSHQVNLILDGRSLMTTNFKPIATEWATDLTIGYVNPDKFPANKAFIGDITQFNLWNRILTYSEIEKMAKCQGIHYGNVISWDREWVLENAIQDQVNSSQLCPGQKETESLQVFPPMAYDEGVHLCEALGGTVPTPKSYSEVERLFLRGRTLQPECRVFWVGIDDRGKEGIWRYHHDGQLAIDIPWSIDEPNGIQYENCGGLEAEGVVDDECQADRCPGCIVVANLVLSMRGSCEPLVHNMNYMMITEQNQRIFIGYGDYKILHNGTFWVWLNHRTNQTMAHLLPAQNNYPMGRQVG